MDADCGLHTADLARGLPIPSCHFLLTVPIGQFAGAVNAHENLSIPTGMGVRPFIAAYLAGCRSHSPISYELGPPNIFVVIRKVFPFSLAHPNSFGCMMFPYSVGYHQPVEGCRK